MAILLIIKYALLFILFAASPWLHADRGRLLPISQELDGLAVRHPDVLRILNIGVSRTGMPLKVGVIPPSTQGSVKKIYVNGAHHGDEGVTAHASLALIRYFLGLEDYFRQELLAGVQLYIQPVVNPDGFINASRYDSLGLDPNRDYPFPHKEGFAFRVMAIRHIRDFMEKQKFSGALTLHSGMLGVLWPWCYSHIEPPDAKKFRVLATIVATAMGVDYVSQSSHDYLSTGEFIDYAYMRYHIPALTLEISRDRVANDAEADSDARVVSGTLAYIKALQNNGFFEMAH